MQIAEDVKAGIDDADFAKKRYTLEMLKVIVTIMPGKYHLDCILGSADGNISKMKRGGVRIVDTLRS